MAKRQPPKPYGRVSLKWAYWWREKGLGTTEIAVLTALCSNLEYDESEGRFYGWYPRKQLAEECGTTEKNIDQRIACLKQKGVIALRSTAYPGHSAEYFINGPEAVGKHGAEPSDAAPYSPQFSDRFPEANAELFPDQQS